MALEPAFTSPWREGNESKDGREEKDRRQLLAWFWRLSASQAALCGGSWIAPDGMGKRWMLLHVSPGSACLSVSRATVLAPLCFCGPALKRCCALSRGDGEPCGLCWWIVSVLDCLWLARCWQPWPCSLKAIAQQYFWLASRLRIGPDAWRFGVPWVMFVDCSGPQGLRVEPKPEGREPFGVLRLLTRPKGAIRRCCKFSKRPTRPR